MKFIRFVSFFLFAIFCCTSYVHASKYILIENDKNAGSETAAFILELVENHINPVQIDGTCNTYEITKIIPVAEDVFLYFANLNGYEEDVTQCGSRVSPPPKKWKCPYCNEWWEYGEECKNSNCATNQWKKKKE